MFSCSRITKPQIMHNTQIGSLVQRSVRTRMLSEVFDLHCNKWRITKAGVLMFLIEIHSYTF